MELRQLEHFVAVAEDGSFTRAALRAHIAQSGLSMSIRSLETELGTRLFIRGGASVRLSSAGRALLPEARKAIAAVAAGRQAVTASEELMSGSLSIGTGQTSPPIDHLAPLLGAFHARYPGVTIEILQGAGMAMYRKLVRRRVDLIIGGYPPQLPARVSAMRLARFPMMLLCAPSHALAERKSVRLSELADEPFIDLHGEWIARALADQAFAAAKIVRKRRFEINDIWMLTRLVEADLGVALAPLIFQQIPSKVRFISVRPAPPTWDLSVAFLGERPANVAARAFLDMLRHHRFDEVVDE